MANEALTLGDSLQLYLTGVESAAGVYDAASSLGGVRLSDEVWPLGVVVAKPIPALIVAGVAGGNGVGRGTLRAVSTSTVAYTAPGGTEGAAVSIADGETKVIPSGTASKWVRLTRDGALTQGQIGYLDFVKPRAGVIGMGTVADAQRAAGVATRRAVMIQAGPNGISSVKAWVSDANLYIYFKTPSVDGEIQIIADEFTDPPSPGWNNGTTSGSGIAINSMAPWQIMGLWIKRTVSAGAAAAHNAEHSLLLQWVENGVTYTNRYYGLYALADDSLERLELYVGTGANPNYAAAAAATWPLKTITSITRSGTTATVTCTGHGYSNGNSIGIRGADQTDYNGTHVIGGVAANTFTFTVANSPTTPATTVSQMQCVKTVPYALTPPGSGTREYRLTVLNRNRYDLVSVNRYTRSITIDSAGAEVTAPLASPEGVTAVAISGGYVHVAGSYYPYKDTDPADTWAIYAKVGSDPVPGVDTPTLLTLAGAAGTFGAFAGSSGAVAGLSYDLGPYTWGTDLRVLVTVQRSSDSAESANTTATSVTVTTTAPWMAGHRRAFLGTAMEQRQAASVVDSTTVVHAGTNTYFRLLSGESQLWCDTTLIWRCVWPDASRAVLYVPSTFGTADNISGLGAQTAGVDAVVGAPKIVYLATGGTRRAKVDITNALFSYGYMTQGAVLTDCPLAVPFFDNTTETLFQVWDPTAGRWVSYLSVASDGAFKLACAFGQKKG